MLALRQGGQVHYLFGDQLGSTSLVVDGAGRVVSEVRYRPWGEVRYNRGALSTRYTYTGQYSHLAEFGLYFYNARWYSPTLGRFTQPDSLIPVQSQGVQAWDRYAYVNNNPVRFIDSTGHGCEEIPEGSYARQQCERTQQQQPHKPPQQPSPSTTIDIHVSLHEIVNFVFIGPPEVYDGLAIGGDAIQVLLDMYCVGVVWVWTIVGGVAGSPGGEFTVPVAGAAGWSWGELEVQPVMKVNDYLGIASSTANTIGDVKKGCTNIEFDMQLSRQGIQLAGNVQVSPTTVNDWLLTLAGLHPLADVAEVSLAFDVAGLLQDFGVVGPWPIHQTIQVEKWVEIPWR